VLGGSRKSSAGGPFLDPVEKGFLHSPCHIAGLFPGLRVDIMLFIQLLKKYRNFITVFS